MSDLGLDSRNEHLDMLIEFDVDDPWNAGKCRRCGGMQWLRVIENGEKRVAPCPACSMGERFGAAWERAGVPRAYQDMSFSSYKPLVHGQSDALARCRGWADEYDPVSNPGRKLLLHGPSGAGKTHLCVGVIRYVCERFPSVVCRYVDEIELVRACRATIASGSDSSVEDVMRPVMDAGVLLLDDLGGSKPSEWLSETVWQVLDWRHKRGLATLITTNYSVGPVQGETLVGRIGARLHSRLIGDCELIAVSGPDGRRTGKRA